MGLSGSGVLACLNAWSGVSVPRAGYIGLGGNSMISLLDFLFDQNLLYACSFTGGAGNIAACSLDRFFPQVLASGVPHKAPG